MGTGLAYTKPESIQSVKSAGIRTEAKSLLLPDWLIKQHVCFDWLRTCMLWNFLTNCEDLLLNAKLAKVQRFSIAFNSLGIPRKHVPSFFIEL